MELSNNNSKGFTPIEPDIYEKLDWDYDLIILCLEYIRLEIPAILKIDSNKIETFLVSFTNFLGQHYPAIGIQTQSDYEETINLDFFVLDEKIENWLQNLGSIENLKQKASNLKCVDWKTLQELKKYPNK